MKAKVLGKHLYIVLIPKLFFNWNSFKVLEEETYKLWTVLKGSLFSHYLGDWVFMSRDFLQYLLPILGENQRIR